MDEFIVELQKHIANVSIGSSTVRGRPMGTVHSARSYLAKLDLNNVHILDERQFKVWMNKKTAYLKSKLPEGAQQWGLARKCLNIFLRDALYNQYLCKKFNLKHVESWLEVPLDSQVAKALRKEDEGSVLPRWKTIKDLNKPTSEFYQEVAAKVSTRKKLSRVHLDLLYWRQ